MKIRICVNNFVKIRMCERKKSVTKLEWMQRSLCEKENVWVELHNCQSVCGRRWRLTCLDEGGHVPATDLSMVDPVHQVDGEPALLASLTLSCLGLHPLPTNIQYILPTYCLLVWHNVHCLWVTSVSKMSTTDGLQEKNGWHYNT